MKFTFVIAIVICCCEPTVAQERPAQKRASTDTRAVEAQPQRDQATARMVVGRIASLKHKHTLRDFAIDVMVEDGVVDLAGRVTSDEQLRSLLAEIGSVEGVVLLKNRITVTPARRPTVKYQPPLLGPFSLPVYRLPPARIESV